MGDPRRFRRTYLTPKQPWERQRIADENKLLKEYGLKSKTELWKTEAELRKYRRLARNLIAVHGVEAEQKKKIIIEKLARIGVLEKASNLDNVLSLEIRDFLERRIQTIVYKKGLANTSMDARIMITHGHISYRGAVHTTPGTVVPKSEESKISYVGPVRVKQTSDAAAEPIMVAVPTEGGGSIVSPETAKAEGVK